MTTPGSMARNARAFSSPTAVQWAACCWLPVGLLAVPLAVYALPGGHLFLTIHSWDQSLTLDRAMFRYHRALGIVHADFWVSWRWSLVFQPVR